MGRGSKTNKGSSNKGRTGSVIDGSQGWSSSSYSSSSGSSENDGQPKVDIWDGFRGGNPYEPGTRNFELMRRRREKSAYLRKVCELCNFDASSIIPPDDPYAPDDPRCKRYFAPKLSDSGHFKDDPEGIALLASEINRLKLERESKPRKVDDSISENGKKFLAEVRRREESFLKSFHDFYGSDFKAGLPVAPEASKLPILPKMV